VTGVLLGVVVLTALAGTGTLAAATIGLDRPAEFVLAAWVVAFAEVVALSLFLSVFGAMTRPSLVGGALAVLAGALGAWLLVGSPRPPRLPRESLRSLRLWPIVTLAAVALLFSGYAAMLIIGTPPNGWDQLNYHLARAAFWAQRDGVGYVDHAYDERINFFPPNGEIPVAAVLAVTRLEVLAALVQFSSALAGATGVFALSRRLGFEHCAAAFGALLFLTLPIVLLQSTTTKNDLVVGALLVAASVFLLGDSRRHLVLAGLAIALAVGTKFTAAYGVAVLVVLALVAMPRSKRVARIVAIGLGGLAGSYWYAVNLREAHSLLGDQSNIPGLLAPFSPPENLLSAVGLVVDTLDVSGAEGRDIALYLVAAVAVAIGLVLTRSASWRRASLTAAIVASPLLILVVSEEMGRPALLRLYNLLGEPKGFLAVGDDVTSSPTTASDTGSWFGPAGLLLVCGVSAAAVALVRRKVLPTVALVPAMAPFAWLGLVALSITYHPWQGRFFIYPVALSAALWGLVLKVRALAWSAVALCATTALLSLVHYAEKPSGLRLLEPSDATSVWMLDRSETQSLHDLAWTPVFRFLDEDIPRKDSVALALGANDFAYPAFGARLEHSVVLVPFGSDASEIATAWLVANPERSGEISEACWRRALEVEGATVFRRVTRACATSTTG
jgi:hypothetical protein